MIHNTPQEMYPGKLMLLAPVVTMVTVLSMLYVDLPLARWIADYVWSSGPWRALKSDVPDALLWIVVVLSGASWTGFFYLTRQGIRDKRTHFFSVTGTVLPLAFLVKAVLKWGFGRMESRKWLTDPTLYGFHWFSGDEGFRAFPSGHMLVFTPLFLALWYFYPLHRPFYAAAMAGMGIALIMTNYHFLGDVIAGTYIGALVYYATILNVTGRR